jgi:hypothetical protein
MEMPKRLWIVIVVLGACARLVPHPWNFTPMMAIGLFAGSHAGKVSTGVLATLFALALSDAVLGFYSGFWYVYAAALISVFLGTLIRERSGTGLISAAGIGLESLLLPYHQFHRLGYRQYVSAHHRWAVGLFSGGPTLLPESASG